MNDTHPTISVVTAIKNNIKGLKWTIASLEEQTWSQIEHVVIDADSVDGTKCFLEHYAPRYKVNYVSEPDAGIYDGMNKGANKSTGDIILFLNGGDRLTSPSILEEVARDWETNKWSWAFGGINYVDAVGHVVGKYNVKDKLEAKVPLGLAYYPHPSTFFSTTLYRELDGYRDGYGWSADQELMIRAAKIAKPRILSQVVTDFAIGGAHTQGSYHDFFYRYRKIRTDNDLMVANRDVIDWLYTKFISNFWTARSTLGDIRKRILKKEISRF